MVNWIKKPLSLTLALQMAIAPTYAGAQDAPPAEPEAIETIEPNIAAIPEDDATLIELSDLKTELAQFATETDKATSQIHYSETVFNKGKTPISLADISRLSQKAINFRDQLATSFSLILESNYSGDISHKYVEQMQLLIVLYFSTVKALENLRYLLGEDVNPNDWQRIYALNIKVDELKQTQFFITMSTYAKHFTNLSKFQIDLQGTVEKQAKGLINQSLIKSEIRTDLGNQTIIQFTLNPSIILEFEAQKWTISATPQNMANYTIFYLAQTLYSNLNQVNLSLRRSVKDLTNIPSSIVAKFPALKWLKTLFFRSFENDHAKDYKQTLYREVLSQLLTDNLNRNEFSILNAENIAMFLNINPEDISTQQLAKIAQMEIFNTRTILEALFLLHPLREEKLNLADLQTLIVNAKKYAVQNIIWGDPDLDASNRQSFEELLAQKIEDYKSQVSPQLVRKFTNSMERINRSNRLDQYLLKNRENINQQLYKSSIEITSVKDKNVDLSLLLAATQSQISELNPSPQILKWLQQTLAGQNYFTSYNIYSSFLLQYLSAFSFSKVVNKAIETGSNAPLFYQTLMTQMKAAELQYAGKNLSSGIQTYQYNEGVRDTVWQIQWNPKIPSQNPEALKRHGIHISEERLAMYAHLSKDPKARVKDLKDWLRIGEILRFDTAKISQLQRAKAEEALYTSDLPYLNISLNPPLESINLNKEELKIYQNQLKQNLNFTMPILGHLSKDNGLSLWEQLIELKSANDGDSLITKQFLNSESAILDDLKMLESTLAPKSEWGNRWSNFKSFVGLEESADKIENWNPELGLILMRAEALNTHIRDISGFSEIYNRFLNDLIEPTATRRAWNSAIKVSETIMSYGMIWFFAQLLIRFAPTGKAVAVLHGIETLFAPIFGPKLKGLNYIIMGGFLGSIGGMSVDAFYTQPAQLESLRKFYECGALSLCAATLRDVDTQKEVVEVSQSQAYYTIGFAIVTLVSLMAMPKIIEFLSPKLYARQVRSIEGDIKTMLLKHGDEAIDIARVNNMENYLLKNPPQFIKNSQWTEESKNLATAAYNLRIQQSAQNLRVFLYKEAKYWSKIDQELAPLYTKFGLHSGNWKNPTLIARKIVELGNSLKRGQISAGEYNSAQETLLLLKSKIEMRMSVVKSAPIYSRILNGMANIKPEQLQQMKWDIRQPTGIFRDPPNYGSAKQFDATLKKLMKDPKLDLKKVIDEFDLLSRVQGANSK